MTLGRSDEAGLDGTTQPGAAQPVASTHALPCVLQISGGTLGRRFELGPHGLVVGRDPENEICADLPSISRRHARLYEKEDGAWLEDLGSTNGTLVNGVPVDGPYQLRNGDQITCGGSIFKYIEGGNVEALYHEGFTGSWSPTDSPAPPPSGPSWSSWAASCSARSATRGRCRS